MRLLFHPSAVEHTVLLADPSGRFSPLLVDALAEQELDSEVRTVPSPEDPPWGRVPPPWVRASWYRAVWFGTPAAARSRLSLVASREASRLAALDPTRFRTIVLLVDPARTLGFERPGDQWWAVGDRLEDLVAADAEAAPEAIGRALDGVGLVVADGPDGPVDALGAALGLHPKRVARLRKVLTPAWPAFRPAKREPHPLDEALYDLARRGAAPIEVS